MKLRLAVAIGICASMSACGMGTEIGNGVKDDGHNEPAPAKAG
jgi:hypothetical protein